MSAKPKEGFLDWLAFAIRGEQSNHGLLERLDAQWLLSL